MKLARSRNQSASLTKRETKGITITRKRKRVKQEGGEAGRDGGCKVQLELLADFYEYLADRCLRHVYTAAQKYSSRSTGTNWKLDDKPWDFNARIAKCRNGEFMIFVGYFDVYFEVKKFFVKYSILRKIYSIIYIVFRMIEACIIKFLHFFFFFFFYCL